MSRAPWRMYLLNHKRDRLSELEERFVMRVHLAGDDNLLPPQIRVDRVKTALSDAERPVARPMVPAAPMALEAAALETADEDVAEIADEAFADEVLVDETDEGVRVPRPAAPQADGAARARKPDEVVAAGGAGAARDAMRTAVLSRRRAAPK